VRSASEKSQVVYLTYKCILLNEANLRKDQNVSILT